MDTKECIKWIQTQSKNQMFINKWLRSSMLYFLFCQQNKVHSASLSSEKFIYKMNRLSSTNPHLYKKRILNKEKNTKIGIF